MSNLPLIPGLPVPQNLARERLPALPQYPVNHANSGPWASQHTVLAKSFHFSTLLFHTPSWNLQLLLSQPFTCSYDLLCERTAQSWVPFHEFSPSYQPLLKCAPVLCLSGFGWKGMICAPVRSQPLLLCSTPVYCCNKSPFFLLCHQYLSFYTIIPLCYTLPS